MKFIFPIAIVLLLSNLNLKAQFYTTGDDPASLKWYKSETENFSITYPEGLDSIAKVYGRSLEKYRIPVSQSIGFMPGEFSRSRMPVILHPYTSISNGVVTWAPKRMELYTSPQAYSPEPMPWIQMLSIHESRHVAQMQFGMSHFFRPFKWIFGEMWTGAMSGLYPSSWFLEGDAVVAETALSSSGRGRTADLLNWYMIAFDNGDFRKSKRWKYGSYRYYTPNEYAFGYLYISGIRYLYDCPDFSSRYLKRVATHPYDFFFESTVTKGISGKNKVDTFNDVVDFYTGLWAGEKESRKPFIASSPLSEAKQRLHTEYTGNISTPHGLYSIKESFLKSSTMVRIDTTGKEKRITAFASEASKLEYSGSNHRIYWSEAVPGARWGHKVKSLIRYYDTEKGRKKSLTRKGKYFNPAVSEKHGLISVTEYPVEGGSNIIVMDHDGEIQARLSSPDSLQIVESAWSGDSLFISGISDRGFGIYFSVFNGGRQLTGLTRILGPQPVKIKDLRNDGNGKLMFTSDRTGVNELHILDPAKKGITRLTSTPYGATDFQFSNDGRTLYYSAYTQKGLIPGKTPADSLLCRKEDFADRHVYKVADKLSEQEKKLAESAFRQPSDTSSARMEESERYRKLPHLFNIHSWAPVYFDFDNITSLSGDYLYDFVSLGATALLQNRLGTLTGQIGYSAHKDPYDRSFWRHSGHAKLTYSGLYPVIEASIDINDRAARRNILHSRLYPSGMYSLSLESKASDIPLITGKVSVYVPFNFSSGGWYRGFIPKVSWSASNDLYIGKIMQNISGSLRAYTMLRTAHSEVYPDWGIGVETGIFSYAGLSRFFSPVIYGYLYGYVPGITAAQGLKLSMTGQMQGRNDSIFATGAVNTLPRGLDSNPALANYITSGTSSLKVSADYAIPVYAGDFSIGSVFYGKRFIFTPHFDMSLFPGGNLFSAGLTAALEFGCFFWIGTPISLGVEYSYNGGRSFLPIQQEGIRINRHFVGPVFSITLPQ